MDLRMLDIIAKTWRSTSKQARKPFQLSKVTFQTQPQKLGHRWHFRARCMKRKLCGDAAYLRL